MSGTVDPKKISALTIIATLVLLGAFSGFSWLVYLQRQTIPTIDEQKREERLKTLAALSSDNQKVLTTYHWIDKSKGIVGIPINRAMQLVVNDLAANHPHPAGPINPPAASPSPSPAAKPPSANPAPAVSPSPGASPASSPAPAVSPSPAASPASSPAPASTPSPGSASSPSPSPSPSPGVQTGNERERARTSGNAVNDRLVHELGASCLAEVISPAVTDHAVPYGTDPWVYLSRHWVPGSHRLVPPRQELTAGVPARSRAFSLLPARSTSHFSPLTSHLSPYVCS